MTGNPQSSQFPSIATNRLRRIFSAAIVSASVGMLWGTLNLIGFG
jgi:hypothetical protein